MRREPLGNFHKGKKFCCMILLLDARTGNRKQRKVEANERKTCVECAGWEMRCLCVDLLV